MAFDIIVPQRPGQSRVGVDQVRVSMMKQGKSPALALRIVIGATLVQRLGWTKGQRVNIAFGREATPERGQLAVTPTEGGHFRLGGAGKGLEILTRTLHPTLKLQPAGSTAAPPVQLAAERLIVKLPDAFLVPRPLGGSIMGDPPVQRRG